MADAPRLFLITPPVERAEAFLPSLEAALGAADVACVLIRTLAQQPGSAEPIVRALAPALHRHGAAVLVEDVGLARRLEVDGVHVDAADARVHEALDALRPGKIVGAAAASSRDAAMTAGEAGVDYVMFGAPGDPVDAHLTRRELAAWWSEIFNVPCVGYVGDPQLAGDMADTGVEFVALCEGLWLEPSVVHATLRRATAAMSCIRENVP